MSPRLAKAIGAALLLHLLVLGLVQYALPPRPIEPLARAPAGTVEFAAPIDVEFMAPPPAPAEPPPPAPQETRLATAGSTSAPPVTQEPRAGEPRAPGASRVATVPEPATATPGATAPGPGSATGPGTATPSSQPHSTLLSMRRPATPGTGQLNTRLGLPGLGSGMGAGQTGGHHRPDILAPSGGRGRSESPWTSNGDGTLRADNEPFHANVTRDGRIQFRDRSNVGVDGVRLSEEVGVPVLAGHFDVTDALMGSLGETLYPYRKLKLMDESREMRAEMARDDTKNNLRGALKNYRQYLVWLWNQDSMSVWDRKHALFTLWDECAEEGSKDVLASARSIRSMTLAFVQRRLPTGSKNAFTEAELRRLNEKRRSSEAFAPY